MRIQDDDDDDDDGRSLLDQTKVRMGQTRGWQKGWQLHRPTTKCYGRTLLQNKIQSVYEGMYLLGLYILVEYVSRTPGRR